MAFAAEQARKKNFRFAYIYFFWEGWEGLKIAYIRVVDIEGSLFFIVLPVPVGV